MSDQSNPSDGKKKDLTGIFDLPQAEPQPESEADPFAVHELQAIEQVESFDSIESLDMIDHSDAEIPLVETPPIETPLIEAPPFDEPIEGVMTPHSDETMLLDASPPMDFFSELKDYSEATKVAAFDPGTRYPFHLYISGDFDPFARDRLLRFIDENPLGTHSEDLDLQIRSGRVFLPRISEFSGIKLIQDLRDRDLNFRFHPSPLEADEVTLPSHTQSYSFQSTSNSGVNQVEEIPVLPLGTDSLDQYQTIDSIQMIQYLRSEILEVEKSELFQELLDRMLQSIKRKARTKGANALTALEHKITPLRMPSQYQVEVKASLLKKLGSNP